MADVLTKDGFISRKGNYLAEHSTPIYCAEVLMVSLANSIKDACDAPTEETPEEAVQRFKMGRDYVKVLDYMMAMMEQEVYPAIKRLHEMRYPEDREDLEEVSTG